MGSPPRPSVIGIETLAYYTLELSRPAGGWDQLAQLTRHARQASEQMLAEGIPVRFLRSIFVPESDACFYLYRAASVGAVREAAERAALTFNGINAADEFPARAIGGSSAAKEER
jgi:Protein of unknown function (DUF4242)